MAINKYFNLYKSNTNEHTLVRDFYTESVQIYGQDVYYIRRTIENEDYLFGEDILSQFEETYLIEMYLEDYQGFAGDDLISKFGFTVEDRMIFGVSVDRFIIETQLDIPVEGDLIYLPIARALFEIKHVEDEQQFYPIGTLPAFKLTCELFRYDNQSMTTGIDEIDALDIERNLDEQGFDPFASNDDIETEADTILPPEDNKTPFGDY